METLLFGHYLEEHGWFLTGVLYGNCAYVPVHQDKPVLIARVVQDHGERKASKVTKTAYYSSKESQLICQQLLGHNGYNLEPMDPHVTSLPADVRSLLTGDTILITDDSMNVGGDHIQKVFSRKQA